MSATPALLESRLQEVSTVYQKLQAELAAVVEARQRLDAQLTETTVVKKEFETLKSENTVYKLIGAVLVPQEQGEAKVNVDKRLEFIRNELKRIDGQIKDISEKADKRRAEIVEIQTTHQALLSQRQSAPGAPVTAS